MMSPILIQLSWIPAHIGLQGNELADSWARRSLGYRMITPSPISHNTLMYITDCCIKKSWQQEWSRRDFRTYKFNIGPTKTASRPIRCEEVALCRLRLGITNLTQVNPWRERPLL